MGEKVPFFILSLLIGILIIHVREETGYIINIAERFGWGERMLMIFYALAFYISGLFIPVGLSAFHPYPPPGLTAEYYIAPVVTLMVLFLVFRLKGQQKREVRAGLLFFLFSIVIVLDLIPIGVQIVKERYVYLPSVGIYFAFAVLILFLFERRFRWMPAVITVLFMSSFIAISIPRAASWEDSLSLWNNVLKRYPDASVPLINRGNAWQDRGDYDRAIADYSKVLLSEPGAADAYLNRGLAYYRIESIEEALHDIDHAIKLGARDAEAYNTRGLIHTGRGNQREAISDFIYANKLDPEHVNALINLGLIYAENADFKSALDALTDAVSIEPVSSKALFWRGMVLLQLNKQEEACNDMMMATTPAEMPRDIANQHIPK